MLPCLPERNRTRTPLCCSVSGHHKPPPTLSSEVSRERLNHLVTDLVAEDASKAIYGQYESFEQCQAASIGALRQLAFQHQSDDFGSYECGVGCRYEKEWDMYVCKETRK